MRSRRASAKALPTKPQAPVIRIRMNLPCGSASYGSRCDRRSGSPRCGDSSRPERSGAKENHRWLVENREDSAWQIGFLQLSEGILRSPSRNGNPQPVGPPVSNDLLMAIDVLPWMRGSSEVLALV